jgi:hypothetical protein
MVFAEPDERCNLLELLSRSRSDAVEAVRPDRSFPRCNPGKLTPAFRQACKRTAQIDGIDAALEEGPSRHSSAVKANQLKIAAFPENEPTFFLLKQACRGEALRLPTLAHI